MLEVLALVTVAPAEGTKKQPTSGTGCMSTVGSTLLISVDHC